jgi:hypothetical protein
MRKLIVFSILFFPVIAMGGPWCLVRDASERCSFRQLDVCYEAVNKGGGYCKPNPREVGVRGNAAYCVITNNNKDCGFNNKASCLNVARARNGGCVDNTDALLAARARGVEVEVTCDFNVGSQGCVGAGGTAVVPGSGLESLGYLEQAPLPLPVE